jgi:probable rRNA maturation factor
MIEIAFINRGRYPVSKKLIDSVAKKAGRYEKKLTGTVEVVLIGNSEMKKMNSKWRGKNRTTDVLSFAWTEEKTVASRFLGQIFISWPKIVTQSKAYNVKPVEELKRILVHGLLHLVGYDHIKKTDAVRMYSLQEKILA